MGIKNVNSTVNFYPYHRSNLRLVATSSESDVTSLRFFVSDDIINFSILASRILVSR